MGLEGEEAIQGLLEDLALVALRVGDVLGRVEFLLVAHVGVGGLDLDGGHCGALGMLFVILPLVSGQDGFGDERFDAVTARESTTFQLFPGFKEIR